MANFQNFVAAELAAYPSTMSLLRWRSSESQTAVAYLNAQLTSMAFPRDEAKLMAIVSFLVGGTPPAPGQPGTLQRLKVNGRLYTLLKAAQDNHKKGLRPSARVDNKRLNYFDGTTTRLATDQGAQAIDLLIRQKYDYAIAAWRGHTPATNSVWAQTSRDTVSALALNTRLQHLTVIEGIWAEIIETYPANTAISAMDDPAVGANPSSHSGAAQAFRNGGYCFRCDSRLPASVTAYGFLPLYRHAPPAEIIDTLPHREVLANKAGMFKDNRDAVGEMVVCVARQMRGSTKFPSPGYEGTAYVYALKLPTAQEGFDTEHWQTTLSQVSLWLPGEKAMREVTAAQVLGHVQVTKSLAAADTEYFRFKFDAPNWTFTANANAADRLYLQAELAAIYAGGAVQAINKDEDFQLG